MEIISYNHELETANLLFSKLFRNILIEKIRKNKIVTEQVNCLVGNRQRILKNLENPEKKATYTFPLIVVTRKGLSVEPDRIANLHNEIKFEKFPGDHQYDLMTPVPIAIDYEVTIISKDQATNDMIISNFVPFFNQDLFVSCVHPKFENVKFNSQVIMNNTITDEHPEELAGTDDDFVTTTCSFVFKTYLFAGKKKVKAGSAGNGDGDGPGPGHEDDEIPDGGPIYDGFIPVIRQVLLDMHAVPYKDPKTPKYEITKLSVHCASVDTNGNICYVKTLPNGEIELLPVSAKNDSDIREISVYKKSLNYDPFQDYTISKYFNDVNNGMTPLDVDSLRWYIDDVYNTHVKSPSSSSDIWKFKKAPWKFRLDNQTSVGYFYNKVFTDESAIASASSIYGETEYPGIMWHNEDRCMDPLSGHKYEDINMSEFVSVERKEINPETFYTQISAAN